MLNKIGILLLCCSTSIFAAEVLKVSKNKLNIAITHDLGSQWETGQKVCIKSQSGRTFCGEIIKVKSSGAICKMRSAADGVAPGDEVTSEGLSDSSGGGLESGGLDSGSSTENRKHTNPKRKIGFGFGGGLVLAKQSNNFNLDYENRKALNLGVLIDIPLGDGGVSFQTGLAFVQKGFETTSYGNKLNYLDIPILMKVRFIPKGFTPVFAVGFYSSYLLSAKYTAINSEIDKKDDYKKTDFGAVAAVGFEAPLSEKIELGVTGSYQLGLVELAAQDSSSGSKNRAIQILGYLIFR